MTSHRDHPKHGGARLVLQINTSGAWKHQFVGAEGDEQILLAKIPARQRLLPHAKWCLLYSNGKRVYLRIDPQSGRADLPEKPTTESRS